MPQEKKPEILWRVRSQWVKKARNSSFQQRYLSPQDYGYTLVYSNELAMGEGRDAIQCDQDDW